MDELEDAFSDAAQLFPRLLCYVFPAVRERFDSDKAMLAASARIIANCWAIRGRGDRVRTSPRRNRLVWDLLVSCLDRTDPIRPPPHVCAAFAYAARVDDWIGRYDCTEGMVYLKAQAIRADRRISSAEFGRRGYMFVPAGVDPTMAMEKGPITGAAVRKKWDGTLESRAAGLARGEVLPSERDHVGRDDVPSIIAALKMGKPEQVVVASHATYLLITRPDVVDFHEDALKAAAAVLFPAP